MPSQKAIVALSTANKKIQTPRSNARHLVRPRWMNMVQRTETSDSKSDCGRAESNASTSSSSATRAGFYNLIKKSSVAALQRSSTTSPDSSQKQEEKSSVTFSNAQQQQKTATTCISPPPTISPDAIPFTPPSVDSAPLLIRTMSTGEDFESKLAACDPDFEENAEVPCLTEKALQSSDTTASRSAVVESFLSARSSWKDHEYASLSSARSSRQSNADETFASARSSLKSNTDETFMSARSDYTIGRDDELFQSALMEEGDLNFQTATVESPSSIPVAVQKPMKRSETAATEESAIPAVVHKPMEEPDDDASASQPIITVIAPSPNEPSSLGGEDHVGAPTPCKSKALLDEKPFDEAVDTASCEQVSPLPGIFTPSSVAQQFQLFTTSSKKIEEEFPEDEKVEENRAAVGSPNQQVDDVFEAGLVQTEELLRYQANIFALRQRESTEVLMNDIYTTETRTLGGVGNKYQAVQTTSVVNNSLLVEDSKEGAEVRELEQTGWTREPTTLSMSSLPKQQQQPAVETSGCISCCYPILEALELHN